MNQPTVFIVDDDEAVRDSIAELVSSIGLPATTFGSAREFLESYDHDRAGCLVLDVRMAHTSGPALQEKLVAMGAAIPIVFISGHGDIPIAIKAIKAGAVDFVQKPYRDQQLLDSINEALQRDAATRLAAEHSDGFEQRLTTLTDREREVMKLVTQGWSSKAIANALSISYRTVEVHRSHILEKLDVRSVPELIHLAKQPSE
jgi:two-component system, LuxR family, response regulator FixJ